MKKISIMLLVLTLSVPALAQMGRERSRSHRRDGFYVMLGSTKGPSFSEFFDYINRLYLPPNAVDNFGSSFSLALGYISRFHRNFAVDVGFSFYDLNRKAEFPNQNSAIPENTIRQELDYQAALFTGTVPILLEFSPSQPVVPYVGIGISIFSIRLDHYLDAITNSQIVSFASRDTRTAVGGHFEAGVALKFTRRLWLDIRGRWHDGMAHIATIEKGGADFSVKQSISQFSAGFDYFFR